MKACKRCKACKPLTDFRKWKLGKDGHADYCKVCHGLMCKAYKVKNATAIKAYNQTYMKVYNKLNKAKYRALRNQCMPKWLTKEQKREIELMYKNRPNGYYVDHITPLLGKNVRGLHVPWNLQYLTASENLAKSNKVL